MVLALIARIVLTAVFAIAGLAKLGDRAGARSAVVAFGAPQRAAEVLAAGLILTELAVAGLLLPAATALYGALGAVALLGVFCGAIAWNLARGRKPECHCFGQLHSAPASWMTVARNGALLAGALFVAFASIGEEPISAVAWLGGLTGAQLVAVASGALVLVVIAVAGLTFTTLVRSYGRVLTRLDRIESVLVSAGLHLDDELAMPELGREPGTPTPFFAARSVSGFQVTAETVAAAATPTLLLFTSPTCGPCESLMPAVVEWQRTLADRISVVVASSGSTAEVTAGTELHRVENVLVDEGGRLYDLFRANGTPSAVLLSPDGTIGSWVASGREWIEHVVEQAVAGASDEALPIGTVAPSLELRSLAGDTVSLESLSGRDTVLLFWNPQCGFCRSMHEELRAAETSANGQHPRVVVVSSGDVESTRAEGFESLVLLDERFEAGTAFAANGTPMAILVDADGLIASPVVAGADAVFDLMERAQARA